MLKPLLKPMQKTWKILVAAFLATWFVLGAVGNLQTAQSLFEDRGRVIRVFGVLLASPWSPAILFIFGVAAWLYYGRDGRRTDKKLTVTCDPNVEGCIAMGMWRGPDGNGMPVRFLRIAVFTDAPCITACKGFLTRIDCAGERRWGGESAQLTFALGEDDDALSKTIYREVPAFLDVLAITSAGDIHMCTKHRQWLYFPRLHEIFSETDDYVLTVVLTGDGISSQTIRLRFNWTKNWQTSFLTSVHNGRNIGTQPMINEPQEPTKTGNTREDKRQDIEIKRLAENWLRTRLDDRIPAFRKAVQKKLGEFTKRGWTASPHMYGAVEMLAREEIELRGNLILEGYTKALRVGASTVTPESQFEIQRDLNALIAAESEQVWQTIQYVADACKPSMPKNAAALSGPTIAKIAADFDLLCAALNRERTTMSSATWS